ncbi:hypothetical protein KCP78_23190 [Salmonella enterica subsp. enterica]|nr:hypothetical protein KCP78_23190 [Salmonella enterica subsp. enterica]
MDHGAGGELYHPTRPQDNGRQAFQRSSMPAIPLTAAFVVEPTDDGLEERGWWGWRRSSTLSSSSSS